MSLVLAFVILVGLAGLVGVMAAPGVRQRFVGNSPLGNAAVPLIAAVLAWIVASSGSVMFDWLSDSTAPRSNLNIFVEDIEFGLPGVPTAYTEKPISDDELAEIVKKFSDERRRIYLTEDEVERLNGISSDSVQAATRSVSVHRAYSLSDVAEIITPSLAFYFDYVRFETITAKWSNLLQRTGSRDEQMNSFVNREIYQNIHASEIFSLLASMASIHVDGHQFVDLTPVSSDCLPEGQTTDIRVSKVDGVWEIVWGQEVFLIATKNDRQKKNRRGEEPSTIAGRWMYIDT